MPEIGETPKINHSRIIAAVPTIQPVHLRIGNYLTNGDVVGAAVCCHRAAENVKRMVKHELTNRDIGMILTFRSRMASTSFAPAIRRKEKIITNTKLRATEMTLKFSLTDNRE